MSTETRKMESKIKLIFTIQLNCDILIQQSLQRHITIRPLRPHQRDCAVHSLGYAVANAQLLDCNYQPNLNRMKHPVNYFDRQLYGEKLRKIYKIKLMKKYKLISL